jgi:MFS family permease
MGVYSTAQFLGPMLGGVLAGVIFKHYGLAYIFILGLLWSGLWLLKLLKDY